MFLYITENLVKKLFKMISLGTLYLSQNTLFVQIFLVKWKMKKSKFFVENMDAASYSLKRKESTWLIIGAQFKSLNYNGIVVH